MFELYPLPALTDNYIWIIRTGQHIWVVDPGDAEPVVRHINSFGLTLAGILLTHQHADHCRGVPALVAHWPVPVVGPANMPPSIQPWLTQELTEGDVFGIGAIEFTVLEVPGHTPEHIAYFCPSTTPPIALVGDTLFGAGCGRAFFSPSQLCSSLQRLAALPDDTLMYCGHEYTLANLHFAQAVEPHNPAIATRLAHTLNLRREHLPTLPTELKVEKQTNPFLRLHSLEIKKSAEMASNSSLNCDFDVFSVLRSWKNGY